MTLNTPRQRRPRPSPTRSPSSTSRTARRPRARSSAALDMPNVGDELHHFGWNACSSALCPWAPHPHVERRYLLVPGLRSSRIHVVDVKDDPAQPEARQGRSRPTSSPRAPATAARTRSTAAPTGSTCPRSAHPDGDGPGGVLLLDHDDFSPLGQWEIDRGPQNLAYDVWWNIGYDTLLTSEWGTPNMVEDGLNPELLLGPVRPPPARLGPQEAPPQAGDRPRRRAPDGARAAPRARPDASPTGSSASSSRPPT